MGVDLIPEFLFADDERNKSDANENIPDSDEEEPNATTETMERSNAGSIM